VHKVLDKTRKQIIKVKKAVQEYAVEYGLQPGDRCGSELMFSQQLKVNRRTVRMAIDALCEEGILERKPQQGIFLLKAFDDVSSVEERVPEGFISELLFPVADAVAGKKVLRVGFDDHEKIQGWYAIIAEYERKTHNRIEIEPHFCLPYKNRATEIPDCDLYFLTFRDIFFRGMDLKQRPLFQKELINEFSFMSSLSKALQKRISRFVEFKRDSTLFYPLGFTFPILLVNQSKAGQSALSMPDSMMDFESFATWLKRAVKVHDGSGFYPFVMNLFHHVCRLDQRIAYGTKKEQLDFSNPTVQLLFNVQKSLFSDFLLTRDKVIRTVMAQQVLKGDFLLCETFASYLNSIMGYLNESANDYCCISSPLDRQHGTSQIMLRGLILGEACRDCDAATDFARFLASEKGQSLFADHGIMHPCRGDDALIERFCHSLPLAPETVKNELQYTNHFFESDHFTLPFEENTFNPIMRNFFSNKLTLHDACKRIADSV
jgi:DNA-binding transcriptional regulator YhcF (GntR family)